MNDRYQIIRLINKDPLGGIYLATDSASGTDCCLRNFEPHYPPLDPALWAAPFTEYCARLLSTRHPGISPTLDAYIDEGDAVLISTYYPQGEALIKQIEQHRFSAAETVRMATDVLTALEAAHANDLCHGAMHTGSIIRITTDGQARYLIHDLGLKHLSFLVQGEAPPVEDPVLMPPESHPDNWNPTVKGDLFMLGQLCYTTLAGGHPFADYSTAQCIKAHRAGKMPALRKFNSRVPDQLAEWIQRISEPKPEKRFASAREALTALEQINLSELPTTEIQPPRLTIAPPSEAAGGKAKIGPPPSQSAKHHKARTVSAVLGTLTIASFLAFWFGPFRHSAPPAQNQTLSNEDSSSESTPPSAPDPAPSTTPNATPAVSPKPSTTPQPEAKPAPAKLGQHHLINSITKRKKPEFVDLETARTLDWLVTTGVPAANHYTQKDKGRHILNIHPNGNFREFKFTHNPIRFRIQQQKLIPRAAIGNKSHAKLGDGWTIAFRTPPKHEGALRITLFLTQWHCDLALELTGLETDTPLRFKVPRSTPGVFSIPIDTKPLKANTFFNLKFSATSQHPEKGFSLGFNGILVEQIK